MCGDHPGGHAQLPIRGLRSVRVASKHLDIEQNRPRAAFCRRPRDQCMFAGQLAERSGRRVRIITEAVAPRGRGRSKRTRVCWFSRFSLLLAAWLEFSAFFRPENQSKNDLLTALHRLRTCLGARLDPRLDRPRLPTASEIPAGPKCARMKAESTSLCDEPCRGVTANKVGPSLSPPSAKRKHRVPHRLKCPQTVD
ncbi:unnamed protein product [Pleuronectes platessa]|uniref:Uncharacterized protein n=1 Tax=Pleuronectes platessa TaxID=8262 RepID=A0A9N7U472_PLEPL|nr:unnamed protein product [Pleuronectes platessa]